MMRMRTTFGSHRIVDSNSLKCHECVTCCYVYRSNNCCHEDCHKCHWFIIISVTFSYFVVQPTNWSIGSLHCQSFTGDVVLSPLFIVTWHNTLCACMHAQIIPDSLITPSITTRIQIDYKILGVVTEWTSSCSLKNRCPVTVMSYPVRRRSYKAAMTFERDVQCLCH